MTVHSALLLVKLLHTIIWIFFVSVIGYVLYAGASDTIDVWAWTAIGLVLLEGMVLALNKGKCPLTPLAARYTEDRRDNFDIFLPLWIARYNKHIFTPLFAVGVILVVYRSIS